MNKYTFSGYGPFNKRVVIAEDEATARHLAMVLRWGAPRHTQFPFSSEPDRYLGEGLRLDSVEPASPEDENYVET